MTSTISVIVGWFVSLGIAGIAAAYYVWVKPYKPQENEDMDQKPPQTPEMAPSRPPATQVAPVSPQAPVDARVQPAASVFPAMIVKWARSIGKWEGGKPEHHNPGNLKYSSLTASWSATKGVAASDGGFLCQFPDDQTGFNALCNFLILGAENQLLAFHSAEARTLEGFTKIYAGNPPAGYTNGIIKDMNTPGNTQISTFLS